MDGNFTKTRYTIGKGCSLSHTVGMEAQNSTISSYHYTQGCMIYYLKSGCGVAKIDGRTYNMNQGDVVVVSPTQLYMSQIADNVFHERLILHVNDSVSENFTDCRASLISALCEKIRKNGNYISAKTVEKLGIIRLFDEIFHFLKSSDANGGLMALCKSIELVLSVAGAEDSNIKNEAHKSPSVLIKSIIEFIDRSFQEDISLKSIAESFNYDVSYLSHLFKSEMGMSIWNYVIYKRISVVNSMVSAGCTVDKAYRTAGFKNYSNFFRIYKKYMSMTPSEFKYQKTDGEPGI